MDSEADLVMEDHPILGKRKRSPTLHGDNTVDDKRPISQDASHQKPPNIGPPGLDSKKLRLASDMPMENQIDDADFVQGQSSSQYGLLPPQVLQQVFCYIEPFQLARLMSVNRGFRALLDQRFPLPRDDGRGHARLMLQDSVWSISRKTFMPDLPSPLLSVREYDMLKLMYGHTCDYCKRPSRSRLRATVTPWNAGPGHVGVRAIWPFKVKSCGECLQSQIVEEHDLMITSASAVQPGLPFVLFTPSLSYVTSLSIRHHTVPPGLKLTKYYFQPQIKQLEQRRDEMCLQNPNALAEWYRNLGPSLKIFEADWIRLEEWEEASRSVPTEYVPPDSASGSSSHAPSGSKVHSATPSLLTSTSRSGWRYRKVSQQQTQSQSAVRKFNPASQIALDTHKPATIQHSIHPNPPSITPSYQSSSTIGPPLSYTGAGVHNVPHTRDGDRAREDDNRGLRMAFSIREPDLVTPSRESVHEMKPLDESDQSTLRDDNFVERAQLMPRSTHERDDQYSFVSRETILDDDPGPDFSDLRVLLTYAQRPTRDKLYDAAKEYIRRFWVGGTGLIEATAPQFAADVLRHVRKRFYQVQEQEDAALSLHGYPPIADTESGIRTRKLKLEHMKHVFEECIKPYTELVTKDLFLCSSCGTQGKYFAFEAMIQHFAAKHTKDFSRGNVIVSWKADWPAEPPFHPQPGGQTVSHIRASPPAAVRYSADTAEVSQSLQHPPSIESRTLSRGNAQVEVYQGDRHPEPLSRREYLHATQRYSPEITVNARHAITSQYRMDYRDGDVDPTPRLTRPIHVRELPTVDNSTSVGSTGYAQRMLQSGEGFPDQRIRHEQGQYRPSDLEYVRSQHNHRAVHEYDSTLASHRQTRLVPDDDRSHNQQVPESASVRIHSPRTETPHGPNAAHEFLESFTPMLVDHADDQRSAPSSVTRLSRPQSRDLRSTPGTATDRRSNMSLLRKQSPHNLADETNRRPEESSDERFYATEEQESLMRDPQRHEVDYHATDRDLRASSAPRHLRDSARIYSPEHEQTRRMMVYPDNGYSTYAEPHHQPHTDNPRLIQYVDAYGRPIGPPSPEHVRYRSVHDIDDRRAYDGGYYERSDRPYDQPPLREQIWNPEPPRQYYPIERPVGSAYAPPQRPPLPLGYRERDHDMYRVRPEVFEQDGRLYERIPASQYPPDEEYRERP